MSDLDALGLVLAAAAVLALAVLAGPRLYEAARRAQAGRELGVAVPEGLAARRLAHERHPGTLVLAYPRWRSARRDGCHDNRTADWSVVEGRSRVSAGRWELSGTDPVAVYELACALRAAGHDVGPCAEELEAWERAAAGAPEPPAAGVAGAAALAELFSERPTDFEELCAAAWRRLGWEARVTPPSKDGGYDLWLRSPDGASWAAECKCYGPAHVVGRPLLQRLVGANATLCADRLLFVTTSSFSAEAVSYADEVGMELVDGEALTALLGRVGRTVPPAAQPGGAGPRPLTRGEILSHVAPDLRARLLR